MIDIRGEPIPTHVPGHPDVILAADCVYYEPAFPLLVQTLHELAGPSTEILFCFKKRRKVCLSFETKNSNIELSCFPGRQTFLLFITKKIHLEAGMLGVFSQRGHWLKA